MHPTQNLSLSALAILNVVQCRPGAVFADVVMVASDLLHCPPGRVNRLILSLITRGFLVSQPPTTARKVRGRPGHTLSLTEHGLMLIAHARRCILAEPSLWRTATREERPESSPLPPSPSPDH